MSDMINQAYDEMEFEEVICRLPSEFAIGSIKRRVTDVAGLVKLFRARDGGGASKVKEIKSHVNDIIENSSIDDIFTSLTEGYHPTLFGWLNDKNRDRIIEDGKDKLTVEFVFNLTNSKDLDGMQYVLDRILSEQEPSTSKVMSVVNKIDSTQFQMLIKTVLKDERSKIRSIILSINNLHNFKTISNHQKMIALKAFAKIPSSDKSVRHIQPIDFKLFKDLKPLERIMALDRYLNYFKPTSKKQEVFDPEPTADELDSILFAGCFEFNDVVEDIKNKYSAITTESKEEENDAITSAINGSIAPVNP